MDIRNLPAHLKVSFLVDIGCPSWKTVSSLAPELQFFGFWVFSGESGVSKE